MTTAHIHDYEKDDCKDASLEQALQFIRDHADGIEKVERSTAWTSVCGRWPEQFRAVIRVTFPEHTVMAGFTGEGVNVTRGKQIVGGVAVDNWPLEYEVMSSEADAFYQAALAEQESAR